MTTPTPEPPAPQRGEIWSVNFDPQVGDEMTKIRPAVVMSVSSVARLNLRIVVPLTDWKPRYADAPWLVHVRPNAENRLDKEVAADGFQVKSLSLDRFRRRIGALSAVELDEIAAAIGICIGG
ncbi:MAG: type II toxin-antitoxin system PemK/MazF family toxin [Planctomycetes bacterium]|nr:type II toxin-antitoxin system PemK/MazF family toxin [Planctomycetota bacterium]